MGGYGATSLFYDGPAIDMEVENNQKQYVLFSFCQEIINNQWEYLHDQSYFDFEAQNNNIFINF